MIIQGSTEKLKVTGGQGKGNPVELILTDLLEGTQELFTQQKILPCSKFIKLSNFVYIYIIFQIKIYLQMIFVHCTKCRGYYKSEIHETLLTFLTMWRGIRHVSGKKLVGTTNYGGNHLSFGIIS